MDIVLLEGNVNYQLTLDPGVWIFDDRKVDLTTYFENQNDESKKDEAKSFSEAWSREIEGAVSPPVNQSIKKYEKEKILTGTFAIPLLPFLINAEPKKEASKLVIESSTNHTTMIPIEEAKKAILGFSIEGKPLTEDGPIHFYYGDGSNKENPIRNVVKLIVK